MVDVPAFALEEGGRYFSDRLPLPHFSPAETDYDNTLHYLKSARAHRACPRWACPREAWLVALAHDASEPTLFQTMVQELFYQMRRLRVQPQLWSIAPAIPLEKVNRKPGCPGKRLVHLLDLLGKAWIASAWKSSEHAPSSFAYGFAPGRRREQAILHVRCLLRRLHYDGLFSTAVLYDLSNAFPSPSHQSLDAVLSPDCPDCDVVMLAQRYRRAFVLLQQAGQELLVSTGCGDLQGDTVAPGKFVRLINGLLKIWRRSTYDASTCRALCVKDPFTCRTVF
ncbi:unnamed protein product, partial [Polarella glacialis]